MRPVEENTARAGLRSSRMAADQRQGEKEEISRAAAALHADHGSTLDR
jgi:hypothetical protein